jgi:hypothetical protein
MRITKRQLRKIIRETMLEGKKKGLWANIHAKKKRGEKSNPRSKEYQDAKKAGQKINRDAKKELDMSEDIMLDEAEYQGRKVKVGKPTAIRKGEAGYGKKQDKVYVKDGPKKDDVMVVRFGDPDSRIRKSNPKARKSFRARHNCDDPGPKTKARYWSCKEW